MSDADRNYLHDLAEEARSARLDELRRPSSHHETCRCRRCVLDEARSER